MTQYVIISYKSGRAYLGKLTATSRYKTIFQIGTLTNSSLCYTRDDGKSLYVNGDLEICGMDGRYVYTNSVESIKFVTEELILKLKQSKKQIEEIKQSLSTVEGTVLKFLHFDFNNINSIYNMILEVETLMLTKSDSYQQYENLFKNSDKPVLCKVSNKSDTLSSSTVFKVIKKEFNILNDSFVTIDNEKYLFVEPLEYRL